MGKELTEEQWEREKEKIKKFIKQIEEGDLGNFGKEGGGIYTVKEVAKILRKCVPTIRRWIHKRTFPAYKIRGRFMVLKADLEEFIRESEVR